MKPLRIEPYRKSRWSEICAIHDAARRLELERAGLEDAFLPLEIAAAREGLFEYRHIDVALMDDRVVGFCAYSEEELAWLYVKPENMRQGVGRSLTLHALKTEEKLRYVEVLWGNEAAKALYKSCGFKTKEILSGEMPGNETFHVLVYSMYLDGR